MLVSIGFFTRAADLGGGKLLSAGAEILAEAGRVTTHHAGASCQGARWEDKVSRGCIFFNWRRLFH
jgi:hypothetical protein